MVSFVRGVLVILGMPVFLLLGHDPTAAELSCRGRSRWSHAGEAGACVTLPLQCATFVSQHLDDCDSSKRFFSNVRAPANCCLLAFNHT